MDLKLKNNNSLIIKSFSKVEYIENTGYPDINTGLYVSSTHYNYKIDAVIDIISVSDKKATIFGSWINTTILQQGLMCKAGSTTQFTAACRIASGRYVFDISTEDTEILNIEQTTNYTKINGVTYNRGGYSSSGDNNYPFKILSKYDANHGTAVVRIYSLKIYENDTLLKDFIPVISYKPGHEGEACLYDTVTDKYYYSSSTGTFSTPYQAICPNITTAYIKDCPNVSGINLLRDSMNLTRVRVDIGTQSGTMAELLKYASYSGFNDAYEQQTKPRIIGSFAVTDYYTNAQAAQLSTAFDGLTISYDSEKCIDDLLDNGEIAIQTLDSTKSNYNPAVAILLNSKGTEPNRWHTIPNPMVQGGGRWFMLKADAAAITSIGSIFVNATTVVDEDAIVSNDNTATYDFTSFDELKYFGVTTLVEGFDGCSKLESVYTHNIKSLTKNKNAFRNCSKLKNLYLDNLTTTTAYGSSIGNFNNTGDGTGIFVIKGPSTTTQYNQNLGSNINIKFRKIIFNCGYHNSYPQFSSSGYYEEFYIKYNLSFSGTSLGAGSTQFYDIGTTINGSSLLGSTTYNAVIHLAYDGMACAYTSVAAANRWARVSIVYVGSGSSRQNDEDVLTLYLADTDWATYSSKLSTWYDYNGVHKWYYVTDNLTNCTNTNPDEWPHITRGESYQTTIVPDEGMTLDSVTVEMYEAVDDGVTPNTPTDITSSVYDSSTGEISIPVVTGNVIITASAS